MLTENTIDWIWFPVIDGGTEFTSEDCEIAIIADSQYELMYGAASDRLFDLLKKLFNHAFVGGIIPVFAVTLYRFIRSDFLAATIPMMLMYISVKILPNYREWLLTGCIHEA